LRTAKCSLANWRGFHKNRLPERNIKNKGLAKPMKTPLRFLRFYLVTALLIGAINLSDSLLALININSSIFSLVLMILSFLFFFFNILSITIFHHQKVARIAYFLPVYYIASYVIFFILSSILIFRTVQPIVWNILIGVGIATSLFEMIFSTYLLRKFSRSSETQPAANYRPSL